MYVCLHSCRFEAEIQSVHTDPVKGPSVKVHFLNWAARYDEEIALTADNLARRFAPKNAHTSGPHIPAAKKKPQVNDAYDYYGGGGASKYDVGVPEVRGAVGLRNLGNTWSACCTCKQIMKRSNRNVTAHVSSL